MRTPGPSTHPRLAMHRIGKSFAGVAVLDEVAFEVGAGEVVALLGANGAGKSTLMKILAGLYRRDTGEIRIDGEAVHIAGPVDAVRHGIRLIPQEVSVHPDMSVAENICLGNLPLRRRLGLTVVDRETLRATARALLARLGLDIAPNRRMGELGVSEQRVVEIARALAGRARILIMDEPTAALSKVEAEVLFSVVAALKRDGVSIVYISHSLDEVFRLTDRIVVLRDGRLAGLFVTRETSRDAVLEAMLGTRQETIFPPRSDRGADAVPRLEVAALVLPNWLDDVSLTVGRGEVLGVFGLLGSGIERIGRAIFGAEPLARFGHVRIDGETMRRRDPAASVAAGIGFVAAERKREGIVGILSVRENVTAPFLSRFVRGMRVAVGRERAETRRWIEALGIRTRGPEQEIRLLSGGNQQKVCLARWLLGDVRLLILEEPTRGVDLGARREIYAEIRKLAERGVAVLLISSDAEEVAGLANRSIVLNDGRIVAELGPEATAHRLIEAAGTALAA